MIFRILLISACTTLIASCTPSSDQTVTPSPDTVPPVSVESPVVVAPAVATTALKLIGTEPFWSFIQTDSGSATFSFPGELEVEEYMYTTTEVLAGTDIIITATPVLSGGTSISAMLSPVTCSDGMSDVVYPYTVSLSYGITSYTGCGQ